MRRRHLLRVTLTLTLLASALLLAGPTQAVVPSPEAPMRVRFEAGTHTGYTFDANGNVLSTKTATLARPSGADTSRRSYITGRGNHLLIVNGIWAGYWVRESIVAHVEGMVAETTYSPPLRVSFPAGTIIGYRFDAGWNLTSARIGSLGVPSGADANRLGVINGVPYYAIVNGGWAGTWIPSGAANAVRPLACHTGPRHTAGGQQVFARITGAGPEVALTFDMGGRVDPAMLIMRRLLLHGVCSTLFPTGVLTQTPIGQQVMAMVSAYPQVFEVGNHTMHHCDLVRGGGGSPSTAPCQTNGRPSDAFVRKELTDAGAIISAGSGQSPLPYWRPPYGSYDTGVLNAVASVGYTKTFLWDIDTIDWQPEADGGPTAAQIAAKVVTTAANGSNVLMHLGGFNTHDALPAMINGLRRSRGFTLSSLSDLLDGT